MRSYIKIIKDEAVTRWKLRKNQGLFLRPNKSYFSNGMSREINEEGMRRILNARKSFLGPINKQLRRHYEKNQFSTLPGIQFDLNLFESIRIRSTEILNDPVKSPCAFFHGEQAILQGIPQNIITHEIRRYTKNVIEVIPDAPHLISPSIAYAIRSCIGSNFSLENIFLTRNFHVDQEINNKYEFLSDRWHFDNQYPDGFSLCVCISNVTLDDGPFHVLSATDSRTLLHKGFDPAKRNKDPYGGLRAEDINKSPSLTRLIGPPGTMLLCHTSYCLHRAGVPKAGHYRDMLFFTFRPTPGMNLDWSK
ncbi:TPA: hypothetical protein ACX87D_001703 [Legionella pneumophila]